MNKLKIEEGKEYPIQLFPKEEVVLGTLMMESEKEYLFRCSDGDDIIVNKHYATIDDKVITHIPVSSAPITKTKSGINYP
jgi:hypothetical protein